jgi:hypothetical protein
MGLLFGAQPRHGRSDMTVEKVAATATADDECVECGYEPELKRTLGSFQIFAISFAFISVAVGIFATFDNVLGTAQSSPNDHCRRPRHGGHH